MAKVLGAILFFVQGFFFLFFLNWPYTSEAGKSILPFVALAICMTGYLIALWHGKYGGVVMICSAVLLAISSFLSPGTSDIQVKLFFILIACLPPAIVGSLFIGLTGNIKSSQNAQ